ncbi:MAG: DNA polymerase III subunit beta [Bacteroidia bacterium]|nr:MAG: DNA polymerase III subunit beta [Bacteroidia bacterium]
MMFITTPTIVLDHLKNLSPILSTNKMNPLLEGFLFEIHKEFLNITAYSQDLQVQTAIHVSPSSDSTHNFENGFVINGKKIIEILQSLPEQPITFILLPDEMAIKLKTDQGEYKISVFNGDQYPSLPQDTEFLASFTIKSDIFKTGLDKTLFAASDDVELRPNLCGVYCQFFENEAVFVATDTHRLIEYTRTDSRPETNNAFILPKKNIPVIAKILDKFDDAVEINYAKGLVQLKVGEYTVYSKLASGEFPKYRDIFPKNYSKKLIVDRNALIASIRRVKVFSTLENNRVQFEMNGSLLKVTAVNEEFNESALENLNCTYEGEAFAIAFNAPLLLEQLQNITSDEIVFEMTEASRAVLVKPHQENPGEKVISLIMPITTY